MSDFLTAKISCSDNCNIGDYIVVSFEIEGLKDQKIEAELPYKLNELSNDGLVLLSGPYKNSNSINFDFISYKEGVFKIEPFKIVVGEAEHLSKSFEFKVISQVKQELKLIDIVPPQKIYPSIWYYLGAVSLVLIIAFLILFLLKKLKPKNKPIKAIKISPYEFALKKLSDVELEKNVSLKRLLSVVTEAVKKFISDEYNFDILDKTSTESILLLKEHKIISLEKINILKTFFNDADLIKFKDKLVLNKEADFVNEARKIIYALRREEIKNEI